VCVFLNKTFLDLLRKKGRQEKFILRQNCQGRAGGKAAHCKLESPAAALVLCLVSLKLEAITHTQTSTVSRLLYRNTPDYFYFVFEYNFSLCASKEGAANVYVL